MFWLKSLTCINAKFLYEYWKKITRNIKVIVNLKYISDTDIVDKRIEF